MRFIFEEDENEDLSFYKALRLYARGKLGEGSLDLYEPLIYRISRASNPAQSSISFEFPDDEKLFELLGVSEDDGWFARGVTSSHSDWDVESYDSIWDDFISGYGSIFYNMDEENMKKCKEIYSVTTGQKFELEEATMRKFASVLVELFSREADWIVDAYHTYLNQEIRSSAKDSITKEINEFLQSIGFEMTRDFDIVRTTPANLIMWFLQLNTLNYDFEELFQEICNYQKSSSRRHDIGGWHDNQYEFRDSNYFDESGYNRDVGRQLDKVLEKIEDDPNISGIGVILQKIFNMGYELDTWIRLPKDMSYDFRIKSIDSETQKMKINLRDKKKNSWQHKDREVDWEGFLLLLHHPELFKLDENIKRKF